MPPATLEDDLDYPGDAAVPEPNAARPGEAAIEDLSVPVQEPVPPPPEAVPTHYGAHPPVYTRDNRLLDIGTNLPTRIARDGGFALLPVWGGLADDIVSYGVPGAHSADLDVDLDGVPYEIPMAGRGVHYKDLRLIPVAAIGTYNVGGGGYAGRVHLKTRRLHGADGSILFGGRDTRRVSLAGGVEMDEGNAMVAFESRSARGLAVRAGEDLMSVMATAGYDVTPDFSVGLNLRFYRNVWDEVGAMTATPALCIDALDPCEDLHTFSAGPTDGGDLRGTGFGFNTEWTPSEHTHAGAAFGYLDDHFNIYRSDASGQLESRDSDRVAFATAELTTDPGWTLGFLDVTDLGIAGEIGYDNAQERVFVTEARSRLFQRDDLNGDWIKGGFDAHARFEMLDHLGVELRAGADHLTVRRTEPRLGAPAQSASTIMPTYALDVAWRGDSWGAGVGLSRANTTAHEAFTGDLDGTLPQPQIALESDTATLRADATQEMADWTITGTVTGFGAVYGRSLLADNTDHQLGIFVVGANTQIDVTHRPTQITLAARGGPAISNAEGSDAWGAEAPGVPIYAVHVGVMRRVKEGLQLELWFGSYGDYAPAQESSDSVFLGSGVRRQLGVPQQDLSVRVGYRSGPIGAWIGIDNLLDGDAASAPDFLVRRGGRTFYAMLDIAP